MRRAVVDTNVLFEGLTKRSAAGQIVDAWAARRFVPCVSTALALEYEEVLSNKLGAAKRAQALRALQALLDRSDFIGITVRLRPMSPDPDDDLVIECAFNAHACIVTENTRDFRVVHHQLGLSVHTAEEFLAVLEE